jgi:hypothetical protein
VKGIQKTLRTPRLKKEAIEIAIDIVKNQKSEVVIHGKDGKIQDKDSYGDDPNPPNDIKH